MSSENVKRQAAANEGNDGEQDISQPPSKRMRQAEETRSEPDFASLEEGPVNISKIEGLVDVLLQKLKDLKCQYQDRAKGDNKSLSPTSSSSVISSFSRGLLTLRTWQRGLIQHCSTLERSCQETCQTRQRHQQVWESLQYEKAHIRQELAAVQNFIMPHLEQVLQERQNLEATENNTLEPNNPSSRSAILQHLQSEIQQRSALEKKREALKSQLRLIQKKYQLEQKTLRQLPQQLAAIEQASRPLQQLFSLPFIGTDRSERLQMAQQLPAALYTLFVSLQEYLDLIQPLSPPSDHEDNDSTRAKMSLSIVPTIAAAPSKEATETSAQPREVQWILPVPDIASRVRSSSSSSNTPSKHAVTVHFQHNPAPTGGPRVITATVSGSSLVLDHTWLLSRLFPIGNHPFCPEEGGYYRWCHYLAGIHLAGDVSPTVRPNITMTSARSIVKTLQRRIRSNATLKYILQSLSTQHKIPTPPESVSSLSANAPSPPTTNSNPWQLVSFSHLQQQQSSEPRNAASSTPPPSSVFAYDVHCKKTLGRNNVLELRATVKIDKAQYPSVPPRWKIGQSPSRQQQHEKAAAGSPLYNAAWSLLERLVNHELLGDLSKHQHKRSDKDVGADSMTIETAEKADEQDEEPDDHLLFAEWILVHQLNKLLEEWEQVATASAEPKGGLRSVRGRDRIPLSMAEKVERHVNDS